MEIRLRRARVEDRALVLQVEAKSTPNLRYLNAVFEHWVHDQSGELIVAEQDGEMVGVGKLTVLPDGTAWLEALRVTPESQGLGVGKHFYRRFTAIARERGVPVMRMYTGVRNAVSRGLAERYGFRLAATLRGASIAVPTADQDQAGVGEQMGSSVQRSPEEVNLGFQQISDPGQASGLLMPLRQHWGRFLVMNRTFYELTPTLCTSWAEEGKVYYQPSSGSVLVLGARFLADQSLHIACMAGEYGNCLAFAAQQAKRRGALKLMCMFSPQAIGLQDALLHCDYQLDPTDYIVMEGTTENASSLVQETTR